MLLPGFKAAHLPTPRLRSSDPDWLRGIAPKAPAFILGGAGGLLDAPGLCAAEGHITIGTNWTLRVLEPTIWFVMDSDVWRLEKGALDKCSPACITVANRGIFGGGVFSVARGRQVRIVGKSERIIAEIGVRSLKGAYRDKKSGQIRYAIMEPFIPHTLREDFHHGGNSACFAIQLAHLMGCDPIYMIGFTLQNGSNYFFGRTNPVTRKPTIYQHERALHWLSWYERMHPGRVRLDPSFNGPIYDVFQKANFDARQATAEHKPPDDRGQQPDAHSQDAGVIERLRPVAPVRVRLRDPEPVRPVRPKGRVIRGR